jgi:hypothetical protein
MEQAGINDITLYENNGITITYDENGEILSVSSTGDTLELDGCLNRPLFEFECEPNNNNTLNWGYLITAILEGITESNQDELERLHESIYGWIPKIELKSGKTILLNDPFFATSDDLNTSQDHVYFLEISPRTTSNKKPLYFA